MLLSICIPVYNNSSLFHFSLLAAAKSIEGYEDKVEIIVNDNASEDDIEYIVNRVKKVFKSIQIKYYRNSINVGLAKNYISSVDRAKGKFVWIIGSDDFLFSESVGNILNIIENDNEIKFIGLNFSNINILDVKFEDIDPQEDDLFLELGSRITQNKTVEVTESINVENLVSPSFNSVMLGAMMTSVFSRRIWNQLDFSKYNLSSNFVNLESIYPHILVFATQFLKEKAAYIKQPAILVGDGARSWGSDDLVNGPLLYIYMEIFDEIIDLYKINGIDNKVLDHCVAYKSYVVGRSLPLYFLNKYVFKNDNSFQDRIILRRVLKNNITHLNFYRGLFSQLIKKSPL